MVNDKNNFINSENTSFGDLFSQSSDQSESLDFSSLEDSVNDALEDSINDTSTDDILLEDSINDTSTDDILLEDSINDTSTDDILLEDSINDTSTDDILLEDSINDTSTDDIVLEDSANDTSTDDILLEDSINNNSIDDVAIDDNLSFNMSEKQVVDAPESNTVINHESDNYSSEDLQFNLPKNNSSVIKVIGVGGGGSNAVNHMITEGIKGVDFIICNTDSQALEKGQAAIKIQLGISLTEGLGAGENPSVGEQAAIESESEIRTILNNNTKMVFITAGMGGGTGTGAAPVIAQICKDLDILTIGIVTVPFGFEGPKRFKQAQEGIEKMRKYVDSLVVINNDKLVEVYGDLGLRSGFAKADETLMVAARGIAEVITKNCLVNIDLNDAKTVLKNSGTAIMGYGKASGENRAEEALEKALDSPLLNDNHIKGANKILLLILSGRDELTINEHAQINQYLQREAGGQANIILGVGDDPSLDEDISITIIATGVLSHDVDPTTGFEQKKVHVLDSAINDEHSSLCDNENDKVNQLESDVEKSKIQINSDLELDQDQKDTHIHEDTNSGSAKENILDFSSENVVNVQSNSILNEKIINEDLSGVSEKNIQIATERKKDFKNFII